MTHRVLDLQQQVDDMFAAVDEEECSNREDSPSTVQEVGLLDQLPPPSMEDPSDIISGYQRFRSQKYAHQVSLYQQLGQEQKPSILVVACSDSRSDPATIFNAGPGQLFVVRNIANLIPPYEPDLPGKHGVAAALEYAVTVLKVKHVVVLGHGGCGGVKAALSNAVAAESGTAQPPLGEFIGEWISLLDGACARVLSSGSFNPQHATELESVDTSLTNLRTYPFVSTAEAASGLGLHGAWFAIQHGELHWRNSSTGRFEVVPSDAK
jgi:carbonic anhydrase